MNWGQVLNLHFFHDLTPVSSSAQHRRDAAQGAVPERAIVLTAIRTFASASSTEAPLRPSSVLRHVPDRY